MNSHAKHLSLHEDMPKNKYRNREGKIIAQMLQLELKRKYVSLTD